MSMAREINGCNVLAYLPNEYSSNICIVQKGTKSRRECASVAIASVCHFLKIVVREFVPSQFADSINLKFIATPVG
jgi:hypothetical protein